METFTEYVVQAWIDGYEYWSNTVEPVENMFSMPKVSYDSEEQGRARLRDLQAVSATTRYRLVRRVTTVEEI